MSLKNFSDEDLYLDKPHISLGEGSNLISNKELFSFDDERRSLSLDEGLYLPLDSESFLTNELSSENEYSLNNAPSLNEESPNILHMFTQNKRKISKLPNINTKKRSKPGKSW
ncbi:13632_t:CDS:1, partial [Cetraspora pellucida]